MKFLEREISKNTLSSSIYLKVSKSIELKKKHKSNMYYGTLTLNQNPNRFHSSLCLRNVYVRKHIHIKSFQIEPFFLLLYLFSLRFPFEEAASVAFTFFSFIKIYYSRFHFPMYIYTSLYYLLCSIKIYTFVDIKLFLSVLCDTVVDVFFCCSFSMP